jgi:hypothetical protein
MTVAEAVELVCVAAQKWANGYESDGAAIDEAIEIVSAIF